MNHDDMLKVIGYCFSAWAFGWASGFLFYSTKRAIEKVM